MHTQLSAFGVFGQFDSFTLLSNRFDPKTNGGFMGLNE
jgi:hypothetical protein